MSITRLVDFCEIVAGGRRKWTGTNFVESGYPAFGAGGINGRLTDAEFERPAVVLSSIGARCGKCFLAEGKWSSLANTQLIFPASEKADVRFLWYQLNDETRWIRSGTGQPFIKTSHIKAHRVYLPPIEEQRRIAAVLDAADALRAKRRQALAKLDTLTQAIFIDMFGDPIGRATSSFRTLGEICTSKPEYGANVPSQLPTDNKPRYLRITDIRSDGSLGPSRVCPAGDESDWNRKVLRKGDIVFARSGATVGKTYLVRERDERMVFAGYLIRVAPDQAQVIPEYLYEYTRTQNYRKWVASAATVVAQPNLNAKKYSSLKVPIPPLDKQKQFADCAGRVRERTGLMESGADGLDTLFSSLQQRAFRGEL